MVEPSNIIQLGLFTSDEDVVVRRIGRSWLRVPVWIAFQMEYRGGLMGLILDYGLDKYPGAEFEGQALYNIQMEAEALWRYWRRHGDQHYYNLLGNVDRDLLKAERFVMMKYPHVHGLYKYELIANQMGKGWGTHQVKAMLQDVIDALKDDHIIRKSRRYIEMARMIRDDASEISQETMPIAV